MVLRVLSILAATAVLAQSSLAQIPPEPTAYTVTTRIQITQPTIRKTYRLGSKVLVDVSDAGAAATRTLYNLETMESLTWRPADPSAPCVRAGFGPRQWLDPFEGGADLAMKDVKQTGTETIHGVATVILESDRKPGFRLWVDPKTGLMWKSEFTAKQLGKTMTYFEVTDASLTPPPISTFDIPSNCSAQSAR
jgi:hypothetical protein